MLQVNFKIDQLKINLTQPVFPNQKIVSEIRRILYKSGIDISDWEKIQCQITYKNVLQDQNKTFDEAEVKDGEELFIRFSMLITLEILNKQFPSLEINVDAFDSTQKFKEQMIQNHLRNTQYDIIIYNGLDGKQIEKDTWIQNAIGNSIPIFLNIQIKQSIQWMGELLTFNFNVFYPISKVIQSFINKLSINGIIALQCQNAHLKPELSYFNHNLPLDVHWQAYIPNELIYRVLFQKQQREKQFVFRKDQYINDFIKQCRKEFNIYKTNKVTLMYQWALDPYSTFAQEAIPNYGLLKLMEEEYKGEFQIQLQNMNENTKQLKSKQIHNVNNDTSLEELSRKIIHQDNEEVIFFQESLDQMLNVKQKMEDLNIYYGATIMYKIVQKQIDQKQIEQKQQKIKTIHKQIEYKKFGVLIMELNTVINIEICIQNKLTALAEIIRYKLGLPKNQIIHFSLGTRLLQDDENINEIMDGKFEFLQALTLKKLDINFKNINTNQNFVLGVDLEDTLRKVSGKLKIEAKFSKKNVQLGLDETFAQLVIFDGETITYELTTTPKEDNEVVKPEAQNNILHQPSPFNSNAIVNENQQQQVIPAQNPNKIQSIISTNDTLVTVNASVGEKQYKFKLNGTHSFETLKRAIFDLAIQGDKQMIKQYYLCYGEQVLRDEQTVSSLNQLEIDIQFKLR